MNISIIIPNYNGEKLLVRNLPHVLQVLSLYKNGTIEIIIIDDASTDRSVLYIEDQISKTKNIHLRLIQNKKNVGFSSSVNRGVSEANGEILILLNTDVVPEKNFLEPLIEHFKDENIFGVGCMDKSVEGSNIILRGRGVGKWERGFLIHRRGEVDKSNTLWISGGSCALRKTLFTKLDGFDSLYNPFYWEDIDLSYRAQKAGYQILFEEKSIVTHKHSQGAIASHYSASQIKTIAYRNQFIFIWKNVTDFSLLFSHVFWLPVHIAQAAIRFDWEFLMGLLLAMNKFPVIINKRFKQKKYFKKTDKEILEQFG